MKIIFCPFCGYKLQNKIYSDANSEKICSMHGDIDDELIKYCVRIVKERNIEEAIKDKEK